MLRCYSRCGKFDVFQVFINFELNFTCIVVFCEPPTQNNKETQGLKTIINIFNKLFLLHE